MKNIFRSVVGLVLASAFLAVTPASAQVAFGGLNLLGPISGASSAADTDIGLYIKYVGTGTGIPTIQVSGAGVIQFEIAGAVDTTVGCPTHVTGIIDVTNGSCDTWGEVINAINYTGSNWRAAPGAVLYAGDANGSLLALVETDTDLRVAKPLYIDSSVDDDIQIVVGPPSLSINGGFWFQGDRLNENPFGGYTSLLSGFREKITNAGTISAVTIYGVTSKFLASGATGRIYSETSRVVWSETPGATTAENQTDFSHFPLVSMPGEHFVFVLTASAADTSAQEVAIAGAFAK